MRPDDHGADRDDAELARLFEHVDHAAPSLTAAEVIARVRGAPRHRAAWAAGIVLALAAGITYALPGSPWRGRDDRGGAVAPAPTASDAHPGGLLLDAAAPALIVFPAPAPGTFLSILLTDDADVAVRIPDGSGWVDAQPDRIVIEATAPDTLELRVPGHAVRVEVRVGDEVVFVKDGAEITAAAAPVARRRYLVRLGGGT